MQTVQQKSLGYNLNLLVPDSVEEFDKLAGETGAALREAIKNVIYRGFNAEFRNVFLHGSDEIKDGDKVVRAAIVGLEELTGIKRRFEVTKPEVKDAEGKVTQDEVSRWSESEDDFETRVMVELAKRGDFPSADAAHTNYAGEAQAVANLLKFDPKKVERKSSGPKKTPNTYVEVANEIVTATGSIEAAVAAFTRKTGKAVEAVTIDALAKAVWEDQKAQKKQIASGYAAA